MHGVCMSKIATIVLLPPPSSQALHADVDVYLAIDNNSDAAVVPSMFAHYLLLLLHILTIMSQVTSDTLRVPHHLQQRLHDGRPVDDALTAAVRESVQGDVRLQAHRTMSDDGVERGRGGDLKAGYEDAYVFTSQSRFEFAGGEKHAHEAVKGDNA
jgi:hypothetical protein